MHVYTQSVEGPSEASHGSRLAEMVSTFLVLLCPLFEMNAILVKLHGLSEEKPANLLPDHV